MKVYVSHISALYFWRQRATEDFAQLPRSRKQALTDCCDNARESNEHIPTPLYFGPGRKDILVPDTQHRVNNAEYRYHIWSGDLPDRSLVELDRHHYVVSPEFLYVLMAATLSVAGLVQLGMELCGTYRLRLNDEAQSNHAQLTTPKRLATFVERCKGHRGYRKAKRALRWVLAGSASPKETQVYERLCLSNALNGYNFPLPRPNGEMKLNGHQQELAEKSTSYGDLYWAGKDVDVEYLGIDHHTGKENMNSDAKRNNALTSRNTRFYTITWDIYNDMYHFDAIAREIARALGYRIRFGSDETALRSWYLAEELTEQEKLTFPDSDETSEDGDSAS